MKTSTRSVRGAKPDTARSKHLSKKSQSHETKRSVIYPKKNRRKNKPEKTKKDNAITMETAPFLLPDAKTDNPGPENNARKRIKGESVCAASIPMARKQSRNERRNKANQKEKRQYLQFDRVGNKQYIGYNVVDPLGHQRKKHPAKNVSLDLFVKVDSTWENDVVILGREDPNDPNSALTIVCVKAAGRKIAGLRKDWDEGFQSCSKILDLESNVKRGYAKRVDGKKYVCLGTRPNRLGRGVDMYSIHYENSEEHGNVTDLCEKIGAIVGAMEKIAMGMLPKKDVDVFRNVIQNQGEKSVEPFASATGDGVRLANEGLCTAVAMARDYRSTAHTDDDCFFSTITAWRHNQVPNVRCQEKDAALPVLQYFYFTDWMVAVPMYEGDILVFNPLTPHGSTNPRLVDASLMSMYVSTRTILAAASF